MNMYVIFLLRQRRLNKLLIIIIIIAVLLSPDKELNEDIVSRPKSFARFDSTFRTRPTITDAGK